MPVGIAHHKTQDFVGQQNQARLANVTNVILFGAGASFDIASTDVTPYSPPLGKDLFAYVETEFPNTWGALSIEQKLGFGDGNFERGMDLILGDGSADVRSLMRD